MTKSETKGTTESPSDQPPSDHQLLAEFAERASALGVVVERLPDSTKAAGAIASVTGELGLPRVLVSAELREGAPDLVEALISAGIEPDLPGDPALTQHEPLGLSIGRLAVAETGSVLLAEDTLPDRAIGMLVAVQVIVCRTDLLVPSLDEAAPVLRELALRPGGSYATLVTGPSRTADIERVLTVGVQGPGRVLIVFVDELT